ncbi:hypothetical protein DFH27DRAFT_81336 [Peziza echinospora]|nr:hypothetical protein DFH27DRAFT_81336 [Peziza echinospora]
MKILTKEEEDAHYRATVKGGTIGGLIGLGFGVGTAILAHKRWPFARNLTLPFKAFYCTSIGTFAAIISADRASRGFEASRPEVSGQHEYQHSLARAIEEAKARRSTKEKFMDWGREWRYSIVSAAWVASMGGSLYYVSKDPFLSKSQKLVQARVYAQGLTLLVLIASAGFEVADARAGKGRYETVEVWDDDSDSVVKRRDCEGEDQEGSACRPEQGS